MDPALVLAQMGGVATTSELQVAGCSANRIREAAHAGAIRRTRRGWYVSLDASPLALTEAWSLGRRTCISAARAFNLPVLSADTRFHLGYKAGTSFGGKRPPPASVVPHYYSSMPDCKGSVRDTVDSCGQCVTREQQLALIDAAINRGLMSPTDVLHFNHTPARRRRWLARHCDGRAQSGLETLARLALQRAGLSAVPQVAIVGVGRVDLLVAGRVIVELDGYEFHSSREAFVEDRRRDRVAHRAGYHVLRYTYGDVVGDVSQIVADVRALLSGADSELGALA